MSRRSRAYPERRNASPRLRRPPLESAIAGRSRATRGETSSMAHRLGPPPGNRRVTGRVDCAEAVKPLRTRHYQCSSGSHLFTRHHPALILGGFTAGTQELHELVTDLGRGFVLYPVAHIVEFEPSHKTGKAGAHLVYRERIELFKPSAFPPNEKGRLGDLRAFESGGQIEVWFGGAIVVQATVKAGALEFSNVMMRRNLAPPMTVTAREPDDEGCAPDP